MDDSDTPRPGLAGSTLVAASDAVLASPLGGEVVLLEPDAGVYYSLNEVGARIWDLMGDPISVDSLSSAIAQEYQVDQAQAHDDVRKLLADLMDHGLAETRPPPG